MGLPKQQQNDRSAYTLLALSNIKHKDSWEESTINLIGIHGIMNFIKESYDFQYAENSRESIRRQTIHQFEQAGIIERNSDDPERATNSPKTVYSLTEETVALIKDYNTENWENSLEIFFENQSSLIEIYKTERDFKKIPVKIDNDKYVSLSPGKHNLLQKHIVEEFGPRFAPGSKVLYLGDTTDKYLYYDKELAESLNLSNTDKLPDVVLYDEDKEWLFFCEAVTSHGPINNKRIIEINKIIIDSEVEPVYVSCFLNSSDFKKFAHDIAWETEVWFSNNPDHMIHYNGDRFFGPR